MGLPAPLTESAAVFVADTSTVINLNATGHARNIIQTIPNKMVVVDAVRRELSEGRRRGRLDGDLFAELVTAGVVEIVEIDQACGIHFERLVIGPAATTLDDGEAATIAYAFGHQAVAIIDERKATRLCAEMFPCPRPDARPSRNTKISRR